MLESVVQVQCS